MARKSIYIAFLLLMVFAAICADFCEASIKGESVSIVPQGHGQGKHRHSGLPPGECPSACSYRCSKTQYRKPCLFYCQKCCSKCRCVPPGTYGHKEVCPCYNDWKTKRGGPKCP